MARSIHSDAYAHMLRVLVEARKARRVTQVELAARLGKAQSFVSEVETRERRLDILEFYAFAQALEVDPATLFRDAIRGLPAKVEI